MSGKRKPRGGLRLLNTLSRKKETFVPLEEGRVKLFTCGPSTYQRAHVGNFRTFCFEDVLQRYLEHLGYRVERLLVFTDVEDKAIEEARRRGIDVMELTDTVGRVFFEDAALLRMKPPTYNPRSSETIDQVVKLIRGLLERGFAYWEGRDVFYDALKFEGFGKLYGLDMSRWPKKKRRFRKDTYPGMRWNLGDFILWHGYRKGDPLFWETEIGRGRPSWNVQDAAMATKHFGSQIDISCGGVDNLYRHHDYTIAIVEALSGKTYANYWLHGAHLFVDGKKMSKARGNVVYVSDLLERGYDPKHIRFFLIYGHYRERLNLTERRLSEVRALLENFRGIVKSLEGMSGIRSGRPLHRVPDLLDLFEERMNDDLDVRGAFDVLFEAVSRILGMAREGELTEGQRLASLEKIRKIDQVLQVVF